MLLSMLEQKVSASSRNSRSVSMSPRYDNDERERRYSRDDSRSSSRRSSDRYKYDGKGRYNVREGRDRYESESSDEFGRKRQRYESVRRTPGMRFVFVSDSFYICVLEIFLVHLTGLCLCPSLSFNYNDTGQPI